MFQLATLLIPVFLFASWLGGSLTLSRGGIWLTKISPKALIGFGVALLYSLLFLDWFNLTPRWIAGGEGYGVIIPVFSVIAAIGLGLLTLFLNRTIIRKIMAGKLRA